MKKVKRKPAHLCFGQINKMLEPHNTQLDFLVSMDFAPGKVKANEMLVVGTRKIDASKRKPPRNIVAAFCPFCGVNLSDVGP